MQTTHVVARTKQTTLRTNTLLKQTYLLLAMTLVFSGIMATISMVAGVSFGVALMANIVAIALLWFVLPGTAQSATGIAVMFGFTGLLGFGLGPMLSHYSALDPIIVPLAMGGTGVIFLALSYYALATKRDFRFMGGFLTVGLFVVLGGVILNLFLAIPLLSLTLSGGIILLMSGLILHETSTIVHSGETNYILAASGLFLSILNLFTALLQIMGALSED